ncbi:hypothetical protein AWW68_19435 [Roseivirga spongicola]|uniref:Uncharacterized protein n=1 Tax=Roseivirga spongicola TaxID=333140 RepID=A0A150XCJ3_9BACT|nr:hypothetical protein [Roseivirga spongicola]KYG76421.1 hypothetical protein AWW68_19435 [Roseivirga spongicola]
MNTHIDQLYEKIREVEEKPTNDQYSDTLKEGILEGLTLALEIHINCRETLKIFENQDAR